MRFTGEVTKRFLGDEDVARRYVSRARTLLGWLHTISSDGTTTNTLHRVLDDGVKVRVWFSGDMNFMEIDVTEMVEEPAKPLKLEGIAYGPEELDTFATELFDSDVFLAKELGFTDYDAYIVSKDYFATWPTWAEANNKTTVVKGLDKLHISMPPWGYNFDWRGKSGECLFFPGPITRYGGYTTNGMWPWQASTFWDAKRAIMIQLDNSELIVGVAVSGDNYVIVTSGQLTTGSFHDWHVYISPVGQTPIAAEVTPTLVIPRAVNQPTDSSPWFFNQSGTEAQHIDIFDDEEIVVNTLVNGHGTHTTKIHRHRVVLDCAYAAAPTYTKPDNYVVRTRVGVALRPTTSATEYPNDLVVLSKMEAGSAIDLDFVGSYCDDDIPIGGTYYVEGDATGNPDFVALEELCLSEIQTVDGSPGGGLSFSWEATQEDTFTEDVVGSQIAFVDYKDDTAVYAYYTYGWLYTWGLKLHSEVTDSAYLPDHRYVEETIVSHDINTGAPVSYKCYQYVSEKYDNTNYYGTLVVDKTGTRSGRGDKLKRLVLPTGDIIVVYREQWNTWEETPAPYHYELLRGTPDMAETELASNCDSPPPDSDPDLAKKTAFYMYACSTNTVSSTNFIEVGTPATPLGRIRNVEFSTVQHMTVNEEWELVEAAAGELLFADLRHDVYAYMYEQTNPSYSTGKSTYTYEIKSIVFDTVSQTSTCTTHWNSTGQINTLTPPENVYDDYTQQYKYPAFAMAAVNNTDFVLSFVNPNVTDATLGTIQHHGWYDTTLNTTTYPYYYTVYSSNPEALNPDDLCDTVTPQHRIPELRYVYGRSIPELQR